MMIELAIQKPDVRKMRAINYQRARIARTWAHVICAALVFGWLIALRNVNDEPFIVVGALLMWQLWSADKAYRKLQRLNMRSRHYQFS